MAFNRYVNENGNRRRLSVPETSPEPEHRQAPAAAAVPLQPSRNQRPGPGFDLNGIGRMLKNILPKNLDTGDMLLLAVLLLLYIDSGDIEILIMLAALFFMK